MAAITPAQVADLGSGSPYVLSIDAEGLSVDILKEWMFGIRIPKVICVEHEGKREHCNFLRSEGYRLEMENEENMVWVLP